MQTSKPNFRIPNNRAKACGARGFSMIEVLVTLLIITVALLGTASLLATAMRTNLSGEFRTLAVFMVSDIAERMEVNRTAAENGLYQVAQTSVAPAVPGTDCSTQACSQANLATYDLSIWGNLVSSTLPQSTWKIVQTTVGNPSTYTITVSWVDRRANTQYATAGTGETFSYTATRTVAN